MASRFSFGYEHRLHGRRAFDTVFAGRLRKNIGPFSVCARRNALDHPRLGLSVSRRVGNAVRRNRLKRLLREAFRLSQNDWPDNYDIVIIAHPHEVATLADYQRLLLSVVQSLHTTDLKRRDDQT